jgi:MFS family permease
MMARIYGYLVWLVASLFVVYSFCLNTAAAVFSESVKLSLHTDNVGASLAMGAFILGFACMQIPAGYMLDRFNARYVVSTGVFLLAIGNVLISYSTTLFAFSAANFIQGTGASFAFVSAAVLIAQWFPAKKFPVYFGLTQGLSCILSGVIHYYFTIALTIYTWNTLYQGLAVFGFLLLAFSLLIIKSPAQNKASTPNSLKHSLYLVFTNKQLVLCSLAAATSFGVLLAYAGLWYIKIQAYYSIENLQAVIVSGMIFLGIGIGTPTLSWLSNQLKSRTMVIHVSLCLGAMFLILGIYLPHFDVNNLIIVRFISFFIGFFLAGAMLFYTLVNEFSSPETRGVAMSVLNTSVFLFNTLMMFIPYLFLTAYSKDFFTYLWTLPFFVLVSILLLYFIKDSPSFSEDY